ncbi:MAG: fibronectin type III domain-containing protein [Thermoplasmata archaeon]
MLIIIVFSIVVSFLSAYSTYYYVSKKQSECRSPLNTASALSRQGAETYIRITNPETPLTVDKEFEIGISADSVNRSTTIISLYYMTNKGMELTDTYKITDNVTPNWVTNYFTYKWNCSTTPIGTYWITGVLDDTIDGLPPYIAYSPAQITIAHAGSGADPTKSQLKPIKTSEVTESSIPLEWTPNEDPDFYKFQIHMSKSPNFQESADTFVKEFNQPNITKYTVTGLDRWTTYYFRIKTIDTEARGVFSNEVSATTEIMSDLACICLVVFMVFLFIAIAIIIIILILRARRRAQPTGPEMVQAACVFCGKMLQIRKNAAMSTIRCPYCGREGQIRFSK